MKNKYSQGFTIIELLVVVAIISVLAVVVLTNVTSYINRGKNAAIRANLATVQTNGGVFLNVAGNFTGFCSSNYFLNSQQSIASDDGMANCVEEIDASAWCACSTLRITNLEPADSYFCVDSLGIKKTYTGQAAGYCDTACPTAGPARCI